MHTVEQRNNLLAIQTLLLTIDPKNFNGASCGAERNPRGCAIHHAYWNNQLPKPLHDWYTNDRYGFWDNEDTCELMEAVFGEGSWELFGDRACEIGHDYHTFMAELDLFIRKNRDKETFTDTSDLVKTTYKVYRNGKISEEMSLDDANKFVAVAKSLGIRDIKVMQLDTIKVVSYKTVPYEVA